MLLYPRPLFRVCSSVRCTATRTGVNTSPLMGWLERRRLLLVGVAAASAQSIAGTGHGPLVNAGTSFVLQGVRQAQIVGTSSVAFVGTGGALLGCVSGLCDPFLALCLGAPGMVTAPIGVLLARRLPNELLSMLIGFVFVATSPIVLWQAWSLAAQDIQSKQGDRLGSSVLSADRLLASLQTVPERIAEAPLIALRHVAFGACAGVLYGMTAVGPVLMTYLALTTPLSHAACVATAMLAHYPRVFVALGTHAKVGNVVWPAVPWLLGGTIVGGYIGSHLLLEMPEIFVKGLFGALIGALGIRQIRAARASIRLAAIAGPKAGR